MGTIIPSYGEDGQLRPIIVYIPLGKVQEAFCSRLGLWYHMHQMKTLRVSPGPRGVAGAGKTLKVWV
jgi:hypothetical protein